MSDYEKKRLFWTRLTALATILILLLLLAAGYGGWQTVQRLNGYSAQLDAAVETLNTVTEQVSTVDWEGLAQAANSVSTQLNEADIAAITERLDSISASLAAIDWEGIAGNVDALTVSGQESLVKAQEGLDQAMAVMDELDIEGLNQAIEDLRTVVEPLANLFGRFGG